MKRAQPETLELKLAALEGKVPETDLRGITRNAERLLTEVTLCVDRFDRSSVVRWLLCGEAQLRHFEKQRSWRLASYLKYGATDCEHDSAYALQLPLIGLQFEGVDYHSSTFVAWVDPEAESDFHVPRPGYNPMKHPKALKCDGVYNEKKRKYCKHGDGKPHVMVPEGFYVPKFDKELYELVRGKRVEFRIGPVFEEEDE